MSISIEKETYNKNLKIIRIIFLSTFILATLIVSFLPFNINVEKALYSYGPAVNFVSIFAMLSILIGVIIMVKNLKTVKKNNYIPVFMFIIGLGIVGLITKINPSFTLVTTLEAFILLVMYFTVENPDAQLISELYKNKKILEKTNNDTARFLFRITEEIKRPIKEIQRISKENDQKQINNYANQLEYLTNKVLNISSINTTTIKVFDTKYNIKNLFMELKYKLKEKTQKSVEVSLNLAKSTPEYLYGDSIKLKQIISSILMNAVKQTTKGTINIEINSIIKYNICRLIINIEDTGNGMPLEQINDILSLNSEDVEITLEQDELTLKGVKKALSLLGGSLMIKSDENRGTIVTIVLDQKIVEEENKITKKLDNYEESLFKTKKIMVIDNNEKELQTITDYLKKENVSVTSSIFANDILEKTNLKNKFDMIILDDEMTNYSALTVLNELKKTANFKIPVIVMLNSNKEGIKLQYLKDGFADCIMKSKLQSEIARVMKRQYK